MADEKQVNRSLPPEVDLPLEVIVLLIGGMALTIAGGVLFFVASGAIPFYENGLLGLLLLVFALQTISMGKTPFGDLRRSKPLLVIGFLLASIALVTSFIPDIFGPLPRLLLFLCLGLGGVVQLLRLFLDRNKRQSWEQGGVVGRLVPACALVHGLSVAVGLLLWAKPSLPIYATAMLLLCLGIAVLNLAMVLRAVYLCFPQARSAAEAPSSLPFGQIMLLLVGIFMVLLGLLLLPVSLGRLPFSGSAQLGLLMIIFALQMLASGNTPIGPFPRSLPVIAGGFLFAAMGIVSCLVPGLLVPILTPLVGLLNILGGALPLAKNAAAVLSWGKGETSVHPLIRRLSRTQLALNLLSILFGTSMVVPGIIPGLVIGAILAANGGVLLYLLRLLIAIDVLKGSAHA